MADTDKDDLIGKKVGHYAIRRRLGTGGMGAVYLAHDLTLDRPASVKVLLQTIAGQPGILDRFQREAKAAAKLNHPNIVQVYGVGVEGEIPYIAMEYVDGTSLEAWLQGRKSMAWDRALSIVGQVAAALDCAHGHGIIHRDIKPANILIDKQGRVRVTDFGIAKVVQAATQLTADGTLIGTPQYMSPEQCGVGHIGPHSDLFSLGVTAYELFSGRLPFQGDTPASLIFKITGSTPEPLNHLVEGIPPAVVALVAGLLATDPDKRYRSARDVIVDIQRIRAGQNVVALEKTTPFGIESGAGETTGRTRTPAMTGASVTNRRSLAFGAGIAIVILAIGGVIFSNARQSRRNSPAEPESTTVSPRKEASVVDESFSTYDADGDGVLSNAEIPLRRRAAFLLADTDGDGNISREELTAARERVVEAFGTEATPNQRRNLLAIGDPVELMRLYDRDGNHRLTPAEIPEARRTRLMTTDANRDGELTIEELREGATGARNARPR